jgi:7,8-dihydropterin-6-yl-methyl-4-(beta-D-ribofuranosyl)aminobenzene 5'-phosphate synthase
MKLWVLMENTAREGFSCEHGLSLYIEACNRRILFDAGQSPAFTENAQKLGLDLSKVDIAILSHGHYDHSGGMNRFLETNHTSPLYLSRYAFEPHHNASGKFIGIDAALADCGRLAFVDDEIALDPGLRLLSCNTMSHPYPTDSCGLTANGQPEDFRHELYLSIEENGQRILISGCSHKGILNIVHWFNPDILVGGFHFKTIDPNDPRLTAAAEELHRFPTAYYTGHCTGQAQFDAMKPILGWQLTAIHAGDFFEF